VNLFEMTVGLYLALYFAYMSLEDLYSGMFIQPLFRFTHVIWNLHAYKSFDEKRQNIGFVLKNKPDFVSIICRYNIGMTYI
jgi:hypothetical protein